MFRSTFSFNTTNLAPRRAFTSCAMVKRTRSNTENASSEPASSQKRSRVVHPPSFSPNKIATASAAAAVDVDPPFFKLKVAGEMGPRGVAKGKAVMYWMRLGDLRSRFDLLAYRHGY